MQQTHHPKVSCMTAAGNGVGVCSCGIPTVEELASLLQGHGPIDFRLCRSRERRPARAKSRDAFLEKGGRMNGTASESLSSGGGGGLRAERSAKRARVEKIVGGMTGSPVGEMKRDRAQSPQEALTADHLKKAKLMFFYTRYPSWRVLRLCFRDVQFTRRGASRLIKWFSNFREFYYIQVERFARRALAEGAAEARPLSVGRESQLFRVLKGHYDKGGRFQVPDGFLEVAELTLRQFYTAVSTGKDRDPSWKKAIYKVICKLDADLPAQFVPYGPGGPADDLTSGLPRRRRRLTPAF